MSALLAWIGALFGGGVLVGCLKQYFRHLYREVERRCTTDYYLHGCFLWVIWRGPLLNHAGHHIHKRWRRYRPLRLSVRGPSEDYPNWRIDFAWKIGSMDYAWNYHPPQPPKPIQSFRDVRAILQWETLCPLWLGRRHATQDSFQPH